MNQAHDILNPVQQSRWRMLIMPWRWSRWTWAIAVPLLLGAYFLSAIPVQRVLRQRGYGQWARRVKPYYAPVWKAASKSQVVRIVLEHEHKVMDRILGYDFGCARFDRAADQPFNSRQRTHARSHRAGTET